MKTTILQKITVGIIVTVISSHCIAQTNQITLPEGTRIRVRLEQDLSSATAEEGQPVQLAVADDVKVGDALVIKQGSAAVGNITLAMKRRRMGRTGKLDFSIERVITADGSSIPLRYSPHKAEGGSHALATGIITAGAAAAFFPAAPFFLLIQGKDVVLHRGTEVDVFTDQSFSMKNMASLSSPAASPGSGNSVAVQVSSKPTGAEIELDGAFVGSTPATLQITRGLHHIAVKRGRASWQRDMQVQAGNIVPVNALLP